MASPKIWINPNAFEMRSLECPPHGLALANTPTSGQFCWTPGCPQDGLSSLQVMVKDTDSWWSSCWANGSQYKTEGPHLSWVQTAPGHPMAILKVGWSRARACIQFAVLLHQAQVGSAYKSVWYLVLGQFWIHDPVSLVAVISVSSMGRCLHILHRLSRSL